ncbi:gamma-secretase subunit PEN-2 [Pimephales promelas]|nr:gamma-secretase subunit PEN-2 [Pimephales promelas]
MNLERIPNEEKLQLCRRYYLGGFAFLPFLWLVNVMWFFKEAFLKPAYTEQPQLKSCEYVTIHVMNHTFHKTCVLPHCCG